MDVDFMFFSEGTESYRSAEMKHEEGAFTTVDLRRRAIRGNVIASDLPRRLRHGRYDVVIKCLNGKIMVPLTFASARHERIPLVLWTGMWDHPDTPFHRTTRWLVDAVYRRADAIVAYGTHVRDYLTGINGVDPTRVYVAGQAVEGRRFEAAASRNPRAPVALFIGQLEERKGLRELIRAFGMIQDEAAHLRIIGSGTLKKELLELSRGDRRVELLGFLDQEELPRQLSQARCLVLPSVQTSFGREPWGLVVNEAMHCGVPVVVSDAVGAAAGGLVRDGRNGLVVPQGDARALAAALARLLSDAELAVRFGNAAHEDVQQFTYAAMASAFESACLAATNARFEAP